MSDIATAKVVETLASINYLTLATVDEGGRPWNAPVFGVHDERYNFYWGSYLKSQHSKNLLANGQVSVSIYDSTLPPGEGLGVYVSAQVERVGDETDLRHILALLQSHHKPAPYWSIEELIRPNSPIGIFCAVPKQIWVNGESEAGGIYIDTRVELTVDELISASQG